MILYGGQNSIRCKSYSRITFCEWHHVNLRCSWRCDLSIWVRLRNCDCLVTWICYPFIAKPGNKTAAVPWLDPHKDPVLEMSKYTCPYQRLLADHESGRYKRIIFIVMDLFPKPWKCIVIFRYSSTKKSFQYKNRLFGYGYFQYKNNTVVRPSYLYNGNAYAGRKASLYWDGPQMACILPRGGQWPICSAMSIPW